MEWLVLRLLEKEPHDRFDSAAEVVTTLATFDTLLANRPAWPQQAEFSDLAPTLPPDKAAVRLDHEARPTSPPSKRSAIPILAGVITVLAIAGAGLAVTMLRDDSDQLEAPVPGSAVAPVAPAPAAATPGVASPATPPTTPIATPAGQSHDTATLEQPAAKQPGVPDQLDKPKRHGPRVAPAGRGNDSSTGSSTGSSAGPVTKPQATDAEISDKVIEVIRDVRQVDPARPGEHTPDGSPMESTIEPDKKPPKPVAPPPPQSALPASAPPKDPSPP